jgi:hypothetical protein
MRILSVHINHPLNLSLFMAFLKSPKYTILFLIELAELELVEEAGGLLNAERN